MRKIISLLSFFIITMFLPGTTRSALAQDVVVIVNKANPIGDMRQIEVKLYYLRKIKKKWPGLDVNIRPIGRSGNSPAKSAFLSSILKMSESEANGYFKQRQFANAEPMPLSFSSDAEIIRFVSENKGAIGYVSQSAFNAARDKVKSVLSQ